jgi:hypothetical protein
MSLIHEEIVYSNKDEFIRKVKDISYVLGIDPNWLMHVMWSESRINPNARNPISGAIGLIQFMPATAASLGTSLDELKAMTNVQQLDYVFKYLKTYKGKLNSYIDLYFSVFFPLAIGKPLDWIFQASNLGASLIAQQNPAFDINKDGKLTVAEVQAAMLSLIPASFKDIFKKKT